MKKILLLTFITVSICFNLNAQVGIGTATPDPSAMLDISAVQKGLLIPRVSLLSVTDAATIPNPQTSLLVYNTNAAVIGGSGFFYNNGTPGSPLWLKLSSSSGNSVGWLITGNGGTDSTINFLGTTDHRVRPVIEIKVITPIKKISPCISVISP